MYLSNKVGTGKNEGQQRKNVEKTGPQGVAAHLGDFLPAPPALERISVWNESVANDLYLHEAPSPGASCLFGRQSLDR